MQDIIILASYNVPFFKGVLTRAHLQKGDLDRVITENEKLVTFDPNGRARFLVHPELHFRLAKLYEQKGCKEKAIAQYQKFLDLNMDAEPGIPEVEEAKKRLAGIKSS